MICCKLADIQ